VKTSVIKAQRKFLSFRVSGKQSKAGGYYKFLSRGTTAMCTFSTQVCIGKAAKPRDLKRSNCCTTANFSIYGFQSDGGGEMGTDGIVLKKDSQRREPGTYHTATFANLRWSWATWNFQSPQYHPHGCKVPRKGQRKVYHHSPFLPAWFRSS